MTLQHTDHGPTTTLQSVLPKNSSNTIMSTVHETPEAKAPKPTTFAAVTPESCIKRDGCGRMLDTSTINLSTLVDLDISIAETEATTGTTTVVPFTKIIEAAMENYQLHDKDSSKLSQVWFACDENQQISMQDALQAAVTDMMNLQNLLVAAERRIGDYEAFAALPTNEENLLAKIQALELELEVSQTIVNQQENRKQRMIANLKKKSALMEAMEAKLAVCEKDLQDLSAENCVLRQGLAVATDARDSYKNKIRSQQEAVKESRTVIQDLEKRLRKTEQGRALECELLDNFRKLAIHTGYGRWGKPIRALEVQLMAAAEEAVSGTELSI